MMGRGIRHILLSVMAAVLPLAAGAADTEAVVVPEQDDAVASAVMPEDDAAEQSDDVDVYGIIFGHIGDSYEWHITDIGGRKISIPLPVIVRSSTGWHCFLSSRLEDGTG